VVFSRYLSTGNPWGVPLATGKLRILIVIASPFPPGHKNYVDVPVEVQNITSVLDKYPEQIHYEILSRPANGAVDAQAIQAELSKEDGYDILHYIGHGLWDEGKQKFCLVMEEWANGKIDPVGIPTIDIQRNRLILGA
jgi:hypothetical protein